MKYICILIALVTSFQSPGQTNDLKVLAEIPPGQSHIKKAPLVLTDEIWHRFEKFENLPGNPHCFLKLKFQGKGWRELYLKIPTESLGKLNNVTNWKISVKNPNKFGTFAFILFVTHSQYKEIEWFFLKPGETITTGVTCTPNFDFSNFREIGIKIGANEIDMPSDNEFKIEILDCEQPSSSTTDNAEAELMSRTLDEKTLKALYAADDYDVVKSPKSVYKQKRPEHDMFRYWTVLALYQWSIDNSELSKSKVKETFKKLRTKFGDEKPFYICENLWTPGLKAAWEQAKTEEKK